MMESFMAPGFIGGFFLFASVAGVLILAIATLFSFIGVDDAFGEMDLHHGFDLLSIRSVSTALAGFGLTGIGMLQTGMSNLLSLAVATPVGLACGLGVAYLLRSISRLEADGTPRLESAIGEAATVYIAIPNDGTGRITLTLQGQTVECDAISMDGPLGVGHRVIVTSVLDGEVLEVQTYPSLKELTS